MQTTEYLQQHHYITEKWIGIARLRLQQNDPGAAEEALDQCVKEIIAAWKSTREEAEAS